PHTQTQVVLEMKRPDEYVVHFKGAGVDVEKYLEYLDEEQTQKDTRPTRIKILADVEQLRLGEGKVFQNVKAVAKLLVQGAQTSWESVRLRAQAGKGVAYKGDMAKVSGGIVFDIL